MDGAGGKGSATCTDHCSSNEIMHNQPNQIDTVRINGLTSSNQNQPIAKQVKLYPAATIHGSKYGLFTKSGQEAKIEEG